MLQRYSLCRPIILVGRWPSCESLFTSCGHSVIAGFAHRMHIKCWAHSIAHLRQLPTKSVEYKFSIERGDSEIDKSIYLLLFFNIMVIGITQSYASASSSHFLPTFTWRYLAVPDAILLLTQACTDLWVLSFSISSPATFIIVTYVVYPTLSQNLIEHTIDSLSVLGL